jgi:hypothetical protein
MQIKDKAEMALKLREVETIEGQRSVPQLKKQIGDFP